MKSLIAAAAGLGLLAVSPIAAQPATAPAAATPPRIIMLRFFVADIARGEAFYAKVFGMRTVQKLGEGVRIMVFPGSQSPGIILIQSPEERTMNGSFIIQVDDLNDTLARVAANGGKLKNTKFEQKMGSEIGRSSHFYDPDGNEIEVLQMSPAKK
ncbi:VOC family protein [Novosphingobium sp.]|uniref:VOC family protein n=1 Tax=Novosphingobium sp. TaxID=1874826 RepID=UPI00286E264A|nr:VOC family protein [Novosphingobium sp.]